MKSVIHCPKFTVFINVLAGWRRHRRRDTCKQRPVFRYESGEGKCIIDNNEYQVADGDAIVVPAGAMHNIINTGTEVFKLYAIYGPPNHQNYTLRKIKKMTKPMGGKI
ncbi:MAG: cupin domain-containing protein [Ferruginibacter sp.]